MWWYFQFDCYLNSFKFFKQETYFGGRGGGRTVFEQAKSQNKNWLFFCSQQI